MKNKEIISLGFENWLCDIAGKPAEGSIYDTENIIAFACAIAAAERERCAKVCDRQAGKFMGDYPDGCEDCAAAIRAIER